MGFLKVFRWILFGFALLFGLTTLVAARRAIPEHRTAAGDGHDELHRC